MILAGDSLFLWRAVVVDCPLIGYLCGYFTYRPDTRL